MFFSENHIQVFRIMGDLVTWTVFCLQAKGEHEDNSGTAILEEALIFPRVIFTLELGSTDIWYQVGRLRFWLVMSSIADQSDY